MKFTVTGTKTIEVTFTVEADDTEDAKIIFDSTDCTVDTTDGEVTVNSCCESTSEIDSVTCDAEEKWDEMSKSERMEMLSGNGASGDSSYHLAGGDFDNLPDEWKGYFE